MDLVINVSKTEHGYSASCDLMPGWIVGYEGDFSGFETYVMESIDFYVECAQADGEDICEDLKNFRDNKIRFKFDIQSLLQHYQSIFSFAALEHITGVNQKQLGHYAAGRSHPRSKQATKIVTALNKLGKELVSLSV